MIIDRCDKSRELSVNETGLHPGTLRTMEAGHGFFSEKSGSVWKASFSGGDYLIIFNMMGR